jgi:hypothetical protein
MFGNRKGLERQLREQGGKEAWATVLEAKDRWQSSMQTLSSRSVTDHVRVKLRVEPDDEPAFEATFNQAFSGAVPFTGWQCKVLYDPNDHSKIAVQDGRVFPPGIDHDKLERSAARREEMMAAARSGHIAEYVEEMKAKAMRGELAGTVIVDGKVVAGDQVVQPAAPQPQADIADELTKLAGLHDRGVLTDEEFEKLKQKLLGA